MRPTVTDGITWSVCWSVAITSPPKTAEPIQPIEMFRISTLVDPRKHVLDGVHIGAAWRIRLNRPCAAAMRPFCQITLATCFSFRPARRPTNERVVGLYLVGDNSETAPK